MLGACSDSSPPPDGAPAAEDAPASLEYDHADVTYSVGAEVAQNTPHWSGGKPSSFAVTPDLPAGITLNPNTGVISGTPTAESPRTTYTVSASNAAGTATADVDVTVVVAAPSDLHYTQASIDYTIGIAIPANSPSSSGGAVESYSVDPALPSGLSFDTSTGVITGTPDTLTARADYTVTASNSSGSAQVVLHIAIVPVPSAPTISYTAGPYTFGAPGTQIPALSPTLGGGAPTSITVDPALPQGLSLDPSTGVISGAPVSPATSTSYTITASNAGGSDTDSVTITIEDATADTPHAIAIIGFAFVDSTSSTNATTSTVGSTLKWTNQDTAPHSAKSTSGEWVTPSSYGMGGEQFLRLNRAGTFNYQCGVHGSMMPGSITVNPS